MSYSLIIPENLDISSVDMCSILGNLIDNAIHATHKLDADKRKISIVIHYDKKRLIISISNMFDGKIVYDGDKIVSINKDKTNHGLGLLSVKATVNKYNGLIEVEDIDNTFVVTIIIPI